jgi:beta-galactosidase GanA
MHLLPLILFFACIGSAFASPLTLRPRQDLQQNQSLVTWDEHSFMIRGERLFLFSGEFHPFRLPLPGLWLDILQKIKAIGFNGVSFYTDWGLLEGNPGHVVTDGIWSLDKFFSAAAQAGIYLLARPGPYINAETVAGGMPGWTLRINQTLRSNGPVYENATKLYLSTLGKIIADAQITNGGPV